MSKPYTINIPKYRIKGMNDEVFDVFNRRETAIKVATNMAVEYPGNTFLVVKKINNKEKIIFSCNIDSNPSLKDIKVYYSSLISALQKRLNKTKYWRIDS